MRAVCHLSNSFSHVSETYIIGSRSMLFTVDTPSVNLDVSSQRAWELQEATLAAAFEHVRGASGRGTSISVHPAGN